MAQLGLSLRAANRCVEPEQSNDSGAGANAVSSEDMVFVTTGPLSELVWSPHKGLCLKIADCNLSDKKGVFWESVLSPPQNITIGHNIDMDPLVGGSSEIMKGLTKEDGTNLSTPNEGDHTDKKGKSVCGLTDLQSSDISAASRKTIHSDPEKASVQGIHNGSSSDPLSTTQSEKECCPVGVIPKTENFREGPSSDQFRGQQNICSGNSHAASIGNESTCQYSTSIYHTLHDTPFRLSACNDHRELALAIQEGVKNASTASSDYNLTKGDSACDNGIKSLRGTSYSIELDVTSYPADEVMQNTCLNGMLPHYDAILVEDCPDNRKIPLCQETDKEKFLSNSAADTRTLNDENSHESVESCSNSKSLILAGKRPQNFDQNLVLGNKRMKTTRDNSHRTSVQRHGSSFMNWISNMVKGSSKSDLKEKTSLDLVLRPTRPDNGSDDEHFTLQERSQQQPLSTSAGFGTIFKSLYSSGANVQETGISNIVQLEEGSKGFDMDNRTCDVSSFPVACGGEIMILRKETGLFSENRDICVDARAPSSPPQVQFANVSAVQKEHNGGAEEDDNLVNLPRDQGKEHLVSSSSSFQNSENLLSGEKETQELGFYAQNKCSTSMVTGIHPLGSQWITRFCPPVSALVIDSYHCEQNVDIVVIDPAECIGGRSQNCTHSVKDQGNSVDCKEPSTEENSGSMNKSLQNCVGNTAGYFGPTRTEEQTNQILEPAVNTVEPSQCFTNSEAMASVFARRVDALRHVMLSEVKDNSSRATISCMFCGIEGHKLQECSEVTESELEVLLRKLGSYDGAEDTPFWCINCFEPNHWAISCPNVSSEKRTYSDGNSYLIDFRNFGKISHSPRRDRSPDKGKRALSDNIVCGGAVALTILDGKNQRLQSEFRAGTDPNENVNDEMILCKTDPDKNPTTDFRGNSYCEGNSLRITSTEYILNGKQAREHLSENVSKEYQITAFYNFVNRHIPTIPRGTFEAIKKLRLSRTDIFRWRRSLVSHFTLEGFFVRLRLRKWEKELGTTGYYVARLNGGLREKSSGDSKASLSVKIGGFKCLVESRFVSNHDFLEDELLAWWCATLKGGENIPSEEDLEMKLKERICFEF